ncbi:MAG: DUF2971 domain-containing protein [Candidatus Thiodiazotropha endolucinida]
MTQFETVNTQKIPYLYHWQAFNPDHLITTIRDYEVWCSKPSSFNDPWDCKPSYNTDIIKDEAEFERHIQWYGRITRDHHPHIPDSEIISRQNSFRKNPDEFAQLTKQFSSEMQSTIDQQYRVFCLCPDVHNTLMWSHYATKHKGICMEFSTRNEVISCALRVEYDSNYPFMRLYSDDPNENLIPILTKSDAWNYEHEYRLVAQEKSFATTHKTLFSKDNYLTLPKGALTSVIVGCQGPLKEIHELVKTHAPDITVKQAVRIPNRYALSIQSID